MRQLEVENELRDVISRLTSQVDLATNQGRLDINLALEDAFIPILKSVYNLPNLINLNRKKKNYPGIDLGDDGDRVAFQITATTSLEKVKKTIGQFKDKSFFNSFDELYILMLRKKQSSYRQESLDEIIQGNFSFSANKQIIDLGDILELITGMRLPAQERVLNEFKIILGEVNAYIDYTSSIVSESHSLTTNLIPIVTPEHVYVAELDFDEKETLLIAKERLGFKRSKASKKSLVKMALLLVGETSNSWAIHNGRIFSFFDIEKSPAKQIIDIGTFEVLGSEDLYSSEYKENVDVFKQLLGVEIRDRLKDNSIEYNSKESFFFFSLLSEEDEIRREEWVGKKRSVRKVCEKVYSKKDPEKIAHFMHLSFSVSHILIDSNWYALLVPSWFYTFNGYKKSFYHERLLKKQKRLEFNHSVRNIVRFVAYYLHSINSDSEAETQYGELITLECDQELVEGDRLDQESSETMLEAAE